MSLFIWDVAMRARRERQFAQPKRDVTILFRSGQTAVSLANYVGTQNDEAEPDQAETEPAGSWHRLVEYNQAKRELNYRSDVLHEAHNFERQVLGRSAKKN